jgi:signal peptidase I
MSGLLKTYGLTIAFAVVAALLIRFFLFEAYRIPSSSMRPTLEPGDLIFVAKWPYGRDKAREPEYGEVIIYSHPNDPGRDSIRRVIGLSGDTVQAIAGRVILNGKDLRVDPKYKGLCAAERIGEANFEVCAEPPILTDFGPTRVPEDSILVMGDFRVQLQDRMREIPNWHLVKKSDVKAKAIWIWLSLEPRTESAQGNWFSRIRFERMARSIQ